MRTTASTTATEDPSSRRSSLNQWPRGISMSSPRCMAAVLWAAIQSETTKPRKPMAPLRSRLRMSAFSQACVPFTRL